MPLRHSSEQAEVARLGNYTTDVMEPIARGGFQTGARVLRRRSVSCRGAVILLLLLMVTGGLGIRCYECVHNSQRMKRQQRYVYPCSDFDASQRFIRDCPDSQLCIYQHITLKLATGTIKVHTMDGCTPNSTQLTRYSETGLVKAGCIQHFSRYKPPSSIYCYCADDLCNGRGGAAAPSALSAGSLLLAIFALGTTILNVK